MKEYMLENSKKMKLAVDFSMNQIPKLSIAIPVYKRHLAVKDLMNSLCRQGNIPKEDWEIVIADDSAEQTCLQNVCHEMQKHKNLPIRYYQNEENIGAASNWNRCMELARAEWVFMIHADDLIMENKVPVLLKIVRDCGSLYDFLYLGRKSVKYKQNDNILKHIQSDNKSASMKIHMYSGIDMLLGTAANAPTGVLIKKKTFLKLGGYHHVRKAFALDVELNLRAMQNGFRIAGTDSVFIVKREGENDTATSSMEYRISWINSIAEMFLASRMIPRGGIYDLLWKLRFRDIAAWGGVELSVLEGDFGKCRIYEIALYRMVQAVWRKKFW